MNKNSIVKGLIATVFSWLTLMPMLSLSEELPVVTYDFPPYNYLENGELVGASTEVIQYLFKEMGYTTSITSLPFKRAQTFIDEGEAAVIFTYTHSPKRRKTAYLSNPISYINGVFFKRKKDNITWQEYKDLADLRVGASGGYYYPEPFIKAIKDNDIDASFVYRKDPDLINLRMLNLGRTDVFICELNVCGFLMNKYAPEFNEIDYINKPTGSIRSFHVGFSKKWPGSEKLRNAFNFHLDKMLATRQLQDIFNKYGVIVDFDFLGSKAEFSSQ